METLGWESCQRLVEGFHICAIPLKCQCQRSYVMVSLQIKASCILQWVIPRLSYQSRWTSVSSAFRKAAGLGRSQNGKNRRGGTMFWCFFLFRSYWSPASPLFSRSLITKTTALSILHRDKYIGTMTNWLNTLWLIQSAGAVRLVIMIRDVYIYNI